MAYKQWFETIVVYNNVVKSMITHASFGYPKFHSIIAQIE